MTINLSIPATHELKPKITVIGVGGAGGNAVNNMITAHLEGVEFVVANTDAQALSMALTERRIQLGASLTQGLGAGARPDIGKAAAEEVLDGIIDHLQGANMVFITAGMGGGTGTGAAPVIAGAARDLGILTVGVITKPFQFEGAQRMRLAEAGIGELQKCVDTLIVIPNQNLFRIANEKTTFADAFKMADDVLYSGVRGVTDLMVMPGLINLDFADIRSVMMEMGKAMMGTGEADGEKRALDAAEAAIANPLLDDVSLNGARGVLVNITGGADMTLYEVDEACNRIRDQVDSNANIIFGSTFDENLSGKVRVSVVATGIDADAAQTTQTVPKTEIVSTAPARPIETPAATVDVEPAPAPKPQPEPKPIMVETPQAVVAESAAPAPATGPRIEPVLQARRERTERVDAAFVPPVPVDPERPTPAGLRVVSQSAPAPQQPHLVPASAGGSAPQTAADRDDDGGSAESTGMRGRLSGASLFERMSRVARARTDGERDGLADHQAEARPASATPLESAADRRQSDDDLLEIPAFLRRQRN